MTDFLLFALLMATCLRMLQAHDHHKKLIGWLDALGDMSGDQRREIINQLKKAGK